MFFSWCSDTANFLRQSQGGPTFPTFPTFPSPSFKDAVRYRGQRTPLPPDLFVFGACKALDNRLPAEADKGYRMPLAETPGYRSSGSNADSLSSRHDV